MAAKLQIGSVSKITGINPITLRAWERRYGLIKPQRTSTGRRLYSENDVKQIKQIMGLIEEGIPVSQVQTMLSRESGPIKQEDIWQNYLERGLQAIEQFNELELEEIYNEAISLHPVSLVLTKLAVPLLYRLGEGWSQGTALISEEHFFRAFLRNKLGAMLHHQIHKTRGVPVIAACLPDEFHELGLLMFSLAAIEHGLRVIILGANTPLEELPTVAARSGSQAIVLSHTSRQDMTKIKSAIEQLTSATTIPVLVGGKEARREQEIFIQSGADYLGDDLNESIARLKLILKKRR